MNSKLKILKDIVDRANSTISAAIFFPLLFKFIMFLLQDPEIAKYLQKITEEGRKAIKMNGREKKMALKVN